MGTQRDLHECLLSWVVERRAVTPAHTCVNACENEHGNKNCCATKRLAFFRVHISLDISWILNNLDMLHILDTSIQITFIIHSTPSYIN